jgi:hypothetical protein
LVLAKRQIVSELKNSAFLVGKLYPVLVDKNGEVIDGRHRLEADSTWPKVEVQGVESEEQRLLARLISNVCRRSVPSSEKTEILGKLGHLYLERGIPTSGLVRGISEKTGMSYRWVMKYAPDELKARPGLGGPKSVKDVYESKVARLATDDQLFVEPSQRVANIASYSNTNFATIMVEKQFYLKLEHAATELGVDLDVIVNNTLLLTFQKLVKLAKESDVPARDLPI